MDKHQKLGYDIAFGVLGLLLAAAGAAFIYSHSWLNQYNPTIEQAALMFSENFREEHELMEKVRVVSGIGLIPVFVLMIVASSEYYPKLENPVWELKKGLGAGVLMIPFGGFLYYASNNLISESFALTCLFLGLGVILVDSAFLIYFSGNSQTAVASEGGSASSYCSNCGNPAKKSQSYCEDCGSKL